MATKTKSHLTREHYLNRSAKFQLNANTRANLVELYMDTGYNVDEVVDIVREALLEVTCAKIHTQLASIAKN